MGDVLSHSQKMTTLGKLLRVLFRELDAHGIPYCVLRNYEGLPDYTKHDVDLMIPYSYFERYMDILNKTAQAANVPLVRLSKRLGFQQSFYYNQNGESDRIIQIDCHGIINYYGQRYINEESIIQGRLWNNRGFWVPSLGSEAAISLMKEYILFGKVKDEGMIKRRITKLVKEDPKNFLSALGYCIGMKASKVILDYASKGNWKGLESKVNYIRFSLLIRAILRNPFHFISNLFRFLWGHIFDEILHPDGLFLCLVGPDGSGKSSIARSLLSNWASLFQAVRIYHGHFRILPPLKSYYNKIARIFGLKKMKEPTSVEAARSLNSRPLNVMRALITVFYYAFEYLLGHLTILRGKTQRELIIFDRYFYDYMTSPRFKRVPRFFLNLISKIIPKPDLIIYFEADPDVIHKRKPELSYETLLNLQKGYRRIIDTLPNSYVCRSDIPFEQTLENVRSLIVKRLNERSLTKLRKVYKGNEKR